MHAQSHYRYPDMVNYIMSTSTNDCKGKMSPVDYKKINETDYIFQNPGFQNNSTALGGLVHRSREHHGYAARSKVATPAYSTNGSQHAKVTQDVVSVASGREAYTSLHNKRAATATRSNALNAARL